MPATTDANYHVRGNQRDDHKQYARTDGTRAFTGGVTVGAGGAQITGNSKITGTLEVTQATTIDAGGLTVTAGGLIVASGNTSLQTLSSGAITSSGVVQGTAQAATLTGTTGRYVGATNGAPASGTYLAGDFANDPTHQSFWVCTVGGTPGTWKQVGGNPAGRLFQGAAQSLTVSGFTKLNLGSQSFLAGGMTAALSASALQVPLAGYYLVCGEIQFSTPSASTNLGVGIFKGASQVSYGVQENSVTGAGVGVVVSDVIQCAANDQLTLQGFQGSTVTTAINNTGSTVSNYLSVVCLAVL